MTIVATIVIKKLLNKNTVEYCEKLAGKLRFCTSVDRDISEGKYFNTIFELINKTTSEKS